MRQVLTNPKKDVPVDDESAMATTLAATASRMGIGESLSARDMYSIFTRAREISFDGMESVRANRYIKYIDNMAIWLNKLGRVVLANHPYSIQIGNVEYEGCLELVCKARESHFSEHKQRIVDRSSSHKTVMVLVRGSNPNPSIDILHTLDSYAYRALFVQKDPMFPMESEIYIYNYRSSNVTIAKIGTGKDAMNIYKRARRILSNESRAREESSHRSVGEWCGGCPQRDKCAL